MASISTLHPPHWPSQFRITKQGSKLLHNAHLSSDISNLCKKGIRYRSPMRSNGANKDKKYQTCIVSATIESCLGTIDIDHNCNQLCHGGLEVGQLMNIFIPQPKLLIQISKPQLVIIPASYKILSWLSKVSSP